MTGVQTCALPILYWKTGQGIDGYLKQNPSTYLTALTRRLSQDLQIHERTLQQCHQFFSCFPELNFKTPLTWSHYRCLLSLSTDKDRKYWQGRIIKEGLSQKELLGLMQEKGGPAGAAPAGKILAPKRGLLYHYRVIKIDYVDERAAEMMIDCGFENRIVPPKCDGTLSNMRIVRSEKRGDGYQIKIVKDVLKDDLYVFKAHVERVIDGDTLLVNIDCGFGIWARQRLRLSGIDAPEIGTVAGLKAKKFVEDILAPCAFVIVKTLKSDKYDRYLADLFFNAQELDAQAVARKGEYLNQMLLDKGLAGIYLLTH